MNAPTATQQVALSTRFSRKYGVAEGKLIKTLAATAWRASSPDKQASEDQMIALMIVADQYNLNPFTKEIYAFEDNNKGIVPVVSVDGWSRIINSNPEYNGVEFSYSDTIVNMPNGKPCPEWCEAVIYHKHRDRPTIIREYLDEVYVPKRNSYGGPWQTHTKRMLRHKALIQGARIAFGFSGIYDEDEASRIQETIVAERPASTGGGANAEELAEALARRARSSQVEDAEFRDVPAPSDAPEDPAQGTEPEPRADGDQSMGPAELHAAIAAAEAIEDLLELSVAVAAVKEYDPSAARDLSRKMLQRTVELQGQNKQD